MTPFLFRLGWPNSSFGALISKVHRSNTTWLQFLGFSHSEQSIYCWFIVRRPWTAWLSLDWIQWNLIVMWSCSTLTSTICVSRSNALISIPSSVELYSPVRQNCLKARSRRWSRSRPVSIVWYSSIVHAASGVDMAIDLLYLIYSVRSFRMRSRTPSVSRVWERRAYRLFKSSISFWVLESLFIVSNSVSLIKASYSYVIDQESLYLQSSTCALEVCSSERSVAVIISRQSVTRGGVWMYVCSRNEEEGTEMRQRCRQGSDRNRNEPEIFWLISVFSRRILLSREELIDRGFNT